MMLNSGKIGGGFFVVFERYFQYFYWFILVYEVL